MVYLLRESFVSVQDSGLVMRGRQLLVTVALSQEDAKGKQTKEKNKEQKDNRNLFLAREGCKLTPLSCVLYSRTVFFVIFSVILFLFVALTKLFVVKQANLCGTQLLLRKPGTVFFFFFHFLVESIEDCSLNC